MQVTSQCFAIVVFFFCYLAAQLHGGTIHSAPIVLTGKEIPMASRYPISSYRLFATNAQGHATQIPFQIDEINGIGDYILDQGADVNKRNANGIFDLQDELSYMGEDVGHLITPKTWSVDKPNLLFQIIHQNPKSGMLGAVYLGVYFVKAPPLSNKKYVVFNPQLGEVKTSRYVYRFDQKNHLVVNGVDMISSINQQQRPIIDSSTFYMKADLKYFLTFEVNHRDIQSKIEAFKVGPIRSIVRVSFFYKFLKINFELGMYTEISLFSNSILLPAIMYNPLNGPKNLNAGSGFYYGFATHNSPGDYALKTNIPEYVASSKVSGFLDMLKASTSSKQDGIYWLSMAGKEEVMYLEIEPSADMLAHNNVPTLYHEKTSGAELAKRNADRAAPLGRSPVNLGLHFDLTKFTEGEHKIAFRLYFDNVRNEHQLEMFKNLRHWQFDFKQL